MARPGDRRRRAWTPRTAGSWPRSSRSSAAGPVGVAGPGRRAGRGDRDGRGRLRAVPAAARLPRPDAAGPHRHGRRPRAPGRLGLRGPAAAPGGAGRAGLWDGAPGEPDGPEALDRGPRSRTPGRAPRAGAGPLRGRSSRRRPTAPPAPAWAASTLPHGVVETPQFMPVGTNATVKALDPDDLRRGRRHDHPGQHVPPLPAPGPRADRSASAACTGSWAGTGPILTDSGGFQVVSLGDLRVDRRRRRHVPQPPRRLAPPLHARSTSIEVQEALGRGHRGRLRPARAAAPRRPEATSPTRPSGPTAGRSGRWPPTRGRTRRSSGSSRAASIRTCGPSRRAFIAGLPFDGICIGGLAGDETPGGARRRAGRRGAAPRGDPRPRYLMGLGSPADLLEAVHRGVDLFDSVLPARVARNGQLWVPGGRLNMRNARFRGRPAAGPGGLPLPRSAGGSRGPTWPTCSGRRSCSPTGSRLVTT